MTWKTSLCAIGSDEHHSIVESNEELHVSFFYKKASINSSHIFGSRCIYMYCPMGLAMK